MVDEVERGSDVCVDMFSSPEGTLIIRLQAITGGNNDLWTAGPVLQQ
jgi:hypothetical protein